MASITWSGWEGGMSPVGPASGVENPVTLIENMVRRDDGTLVRRSGFYANTYTETPRNHIVANLVEATTPYLILKTDTGWDYKSSRSAPSALVATGLVTVSQSPEGGSRGSFAMFGGELYYCDTRTIWRWDGGGTTLSNTGMPYFDLGDPSSTFTYCATFDPDDETSWWLNGCEYDSNCEVIDEESCNLRAGSKSGSFSISFSWYDSVRHIYGPRSKATTEVIAAYSGGPVKLFGWNTTIPTPAADYSSTYDIAIWCSQSVSIEVIQREFNLSTGEVEYTLSHQVGDELSDLHFYEGTASAVGEGYTLRKDNATLAKDGPALDVYEPPHPSSAMLILPDGTTLYFNPTTTLGGSEQRHAIEYSVGHPEQIGRDGANIQRRAANGPTITYAANQKGKILASFSNVGGESAILTDQEVYIVRFNNGVVDLIPQGQSRGVRSQASICESSLGITYMADEGHVMISGQETMLLDKMVGYSTYTGWLSTTQKGLMASGAVLDMLFLWMPDFDPLQVARTGGPVVSSDFKSALVYDHAEKFLSKFTLGTSVSVLYCCGAKLDDGSRLYCYTGSKELYWPSSANQDDSNNFRSRIVVWMNQDEVVTKRIKSLTVVYGNVASDTSSGPEVIVTALEHWNTPTARAKTKRASSVNHRDLDVRNKRVVYHEFNGMQGRYFEIEVRTDSGTDGVVWTTGSFEVVSISIEYESETEEGNLGAPGLNN